MRKLGGLIAAAFMLGLAGPAHSVNLDCERVEAKTGKQVNYGGRTLQKLSTAVDNDVDAACAPWQHASDYWKYGDYYPLWDNKPFKASEKDKNQFATSRPPYNMVRMKCSLHGKKQLVGYFAYHWIAAERPRDGESRGTVTLDLVCTTQDGRRKGGVGTAMLDKTVQQVSENMLDGQSFRLELVALKDAEPFYNRFELSCSDEGEGKKYSTKVTKQKSKLASIPVRRWFYENEDGFCQPVTFGCVAGDVLQDAVDKHRIKTLQQAEADGYSDCEWPDAEPIAFDKIPHK